MTNCKKATLLFACVGLISFSGQLGAVSRRIQFAFPAGTYGDFYAVENGYSIFLKHAKPQLDARSIHIVDSTGREVLAVDLFNHLEGASDFAVWDVSVGKSGMVAIAVVAVNGKTQPVPLLVVFNLMGNLLNAQRLDSSMELAQLRVDNDDTIWGVAKGRGNKDASQVPMFLKITNNGKKFEGLFPRAAFPSNESITKNVVRNSGVLSFGITERTVWCWFPASKEMVSFEKNGTNLNRFYTGVPVPSDTELVGLQLVTRVLRTVVTESGQILSSVAYASMDSGVGKTYLYCWDPATNQWQKVAHNGVESRARRLIGVDGTELVFAIRGENMAISWESVNSR